MTWTTERPTKEGWYWYQDSEMGPEIIQVQLDEDGVGFVVDCGFGHVIPVQEIGLGDNREWAGPIPLPDDPEEG